ncbi:hypothetical protein FHS42_007476 [Streptomyces zagrosensis]|uniref:Uncharacterized protein n=2 Tax=Streptomyces zagrosensis TaxID=1042984 RepID=A0A7W9QII1_9ACTN|nr:hypothetical protein [Streptomyces zagrosensis]
MRGIREQGDEIPKVKLYFGKDDAGQPIELEVFDLGNGIGCVDVHPVELLHRLEMLPDTSENRKVRDRYLKLREKQDARKKESWADREGFVKYVEALLKKLMEPGEGEKGKKLVEGLAKLAPIPEGYDPKSPTEYDPLKYRESYARNRNGGNVQVLELSAGGKAGGDSGLRVLIANAGRSATESTYLPAGEAQSSNHRGTWGIVGVPHGVITQIGDSLYPPEVALGYLLRYAGSGLSGSIDNSEVNLPLASKWTKAHKYERATADLTAFEALGNDAAMRHYLKFYTRSGDKESGLPESREACRVADGYEERLQSVRPEDMEKDPGLKKFVADSKELADLREKVLRITEKGLCSDRDVKARTSPAQAADFDLVVEWDLMVDPNTLTRDEYENPKTSRVRGLVRNMRFAWGPTYCPPLACFLALKNFAHGLDLGVSVLKRIAKGEDPYREGDPPEPDQGELANSLGELLQRGLVPHDWYSGIQKGAKYLIRIGKMLNYAAHKVPDIRHEARTWKEIALDKLEYGRRNPGEIALDVGTVVWDLLPVAFDVVKSMLPPGVAAGALSETDFIKKMIGEGWDYIKALRPGLEDEARMPYNRRGLLFRLSEKSRDIEKQAEGIKDALLAPKGVSGSALYRSTGAWDLTRLKKTSNWRAPLSFGEVSEFPTPIGDLPQYQLHPNDRAISRPLYKRGLLNPEYVCSPGDFLGIVQHPTPAELFKRRTNYDDASGASGGLAPPALEQPLGPPQDPFSGLSDPVPGTSRAPY